MNKTDKRQFIDEISFLGKQKQHSATFIKALKGGITFKDVEKILEDKRKVYNYALTNIYRKYSVVHDDLYGELDKIWSICLAEKSGSKQKKLVKSLTGSTIGVGAAASGAGGLTAAVTGTTAAGVAGPLILGIPIYLLIKVQFKVKKIWKRYKKNAQIFSEKYIASC